MTSAHDTERLAARGDAEELISHFIPSVELTGSRQDKLRKLHIVIVYLQQLRDSLAGDATVGPANTVRAARSTWRWFTAGFVIGAVCALLLVTARRWGL